MKKTRFLRTLLLTGATAMLTGCVSVHKVSHTDAPRTNVKFESLAAAGTFYDALLVSRFPGAGKHSKLLVGQTLYTRETRPSANVMFNTAAATADLNADGTILESEAEAFAHSLPRSTR